MEWEPQDPAAYLHACETKVPIELEASSYSRCKFTRARVASKTNRRHVLEQLAADEEPMVVVNVVDNSACSGDLVHSVSTSLIVHSNAKWHVVWEALIRNPHTQDEMRTLLKHKECERRAKIRRDVKLPPLAELAPPQPPPLTRLAERRLALSILHTHRRNKGKPKEKRIPWHMTLAGWKEYTNHPSKLVRDEAKRHPKCPRHLRKKKT